MGGSGFLINVPIDGHKNWGSLCAVTNKHILDERFRFIRLNTKGGGVHVIETERYNWIDHPARYDVSILSLDVDGGALDYLLISTEKFIPREIIDDYGICPGDEAFIVGRLITPWGQQRNKPAVRFGNISMMAYPDELARGWGECRARSLLCRMPIIEWV